ncbi:MAG: tetratricopeptide repeat protein [Chloroflexota bacterium]|nr:tetratricopeptide repeat protein [Chloroflexota bacterium]
MPPTASLGSWIKECRQALDLTQADLAQRVGCAVDTIYRLEAGTRRPSKEIAARLAAVLEIPAEQISAFLRLARAAPAAAPEQPLPAASTAGPAATPALPPRQHPAAYQTNLPTPPTPLVGREQEVADLRAELLRQDMRLLTLLGPGGVGKTRLSLEVAAEVRDDFADGVFFVSLEAITDPGLVARAIAEALGVKEATGETVQESLLASLRAKQLLLVLDNFEQVIAAAPLVAELLSRCGALKTLVTSREPLRLRGEWLFDLEGLGYPVEGATDGLEDHSAVRLFVQRAQQVQRQWSPVKREMEAIIRICRLAEGLPLAIELAAAAVRDHSCVEIAHALERGLHALAVAARDTPERHQSIQATLEYSSRLLSMEERGLLARLAIFRGGFGEEAAVEVGDAAPTVLAALLAKSLVRQMVQVDGTRRYQLHALVLQYADEKLREAGEQIIMRDRHLHYYLQQIEVVEAQLYGREQARWLAHLEREHDNLRAALSWAIERGAVEHALRLAAALEHFWYLHGYWTEGRAWLARVLAQSDPAAPTQVRGCVLLAAGELADAQCDYPQAMAFYEESLTLFRELGDDLHIALAIQGLAHVALNQRNYEQARTLFEASLPLLRVNGNNLSIGRALHGLGDVLLMQGNLELAAARFEEGLGYYRAAGDQGAIAASLIYAGDVAHQRGDLSRARALCEEGLLLSRELGHKLGISWALGRLGAIMQDEGDYERAEACFGECLQVRHELRDTQGIAWALEGLAAVAAGRRQPERAAQLWGQAEALREAVGAPLSLTVRATYERHVMVARAEMDEDRFAVAWAAGQRMSLEQAIAYALETGEPAR